MHCTKQKNKDLIEYTFTITGIVAMNSNIECKHLLISSTQFTRQNKRHWHISVLKCISGIISLLWQNEPCYANALSEHIKHYTGRLRLVHYIQGISHLSLFGLINTYDHQLYLTMHRTIRLMGYQTRVRLGVWYSPLLYGWSKCMAVIGSNRVTWYKINFTTDYPAGQ